MVNELQVFSFENKEVRTVIINDEPYWVLKDVCDVLEIKNATDVSKRLDEDEVTRFNLGGLVGEVNIINEWEPSKATQYLLSYKLSNHEITQNH